MRSLALSLWIVAIAAARILSTYPQIGITFDEPAHLLCGIQYLSQHEYTIEPQHPPLARVAASLGPYLAGVRPTGDSGVPEGVAEFYQDGHVGRHLVLDRMGILPFFLLACVTVFFWTRHHFGDGTAVLATAIFTLFPSILAHSGLGTTDMPLTACLGAAFLCLIAWAERPGRRRGAVLGLAAGLAVLSKFTALLYLPASAALALAAWLAVSRPHPRALPKLVRERWSSLAVAAGVASLTVWAGYRFSFGPVTDWPVSLPAPELFSGLEQVWFHNEAGHTAWFLGEYSSEGWWYFFPLMLLLKAPLGLIALAAAGLPAVWKRRGEARVWLPLALMGGTLIPAMAGRISIGTRHVLPVYLGLAILGALGAESLFRRRGTRWVPAVLIAWAAVSGALHHPDYISYFNELAPHPENIVADSDLDWGQGSVLLAKRFRRLGVPEATCSFWNISNEQLRVWPGLNCRPLLPQPVTGWIAVSPTEWRIGNYGYGDGFAGNRLWFADWKPVARIGGQLLYYNPPPPGRGSAVAAIPRGGRGRP
jgi:4-amino-4-deoxy-L-arabinose transferase-like glycosyltransferase